MKNPIHKTSLRTDISLWLDQTDALIDRINSSESASGGDNDIAPKLLALRQAQKHVADLFAKKSGYTPGTTCAS